MTPKRIGPCVYISNLPRTTTRVAWKAIYRLTRVTQRESEKVGMDVMLFGTGFMAYKFGEDPEHIPIEKIRIEL